MGLCLLRALLGNAQVHVRQAHRRFLTLRLLFGLEADCLSITGGHAQPATNAIVKVDEGSTVLYVNGIHLTAFHADLATDTQVRFRDSVVIRQDRVCGLGHHFKILQNLAAAAATATDVRHVLGI